MVWMEWMDKWYVYTTSALSFMTVVELYKHIRKLESNLKSLSEIWHPDSTRVVRKIRVLVIVLFCSITKIRKKIPSTIN